MGALQELLGSMEATVIRYGAVVIGPRSHWGVLFDKMTTSTTAMSSKQNLPHPTQAQGAKILINQSNQVCFRTNERMTTVLSKMTFFRTQGEGQ